MVVVLCFVCIAREEYGLVPGLEVTWRRDVVGRENVSFLDHFSGTRNRGGFLSYPDFQCSHPVIDDCRTGGGGGNGGTIPR